MEQRARRKSINYSHLPHISSISHGELFVALQNISIYKTLRQARHRDEENTTYQLTSEVYTVSVDTILLLDCVWDKSGTYRKCLLPMPGWIYFQKHNINSSITYGLIAITRHTLRRRQQQKEEEQEKPNCLSRLINSRHIKKLILYFREHPWLINLIILFIQGGIEIVIFVDIILDINVIIQFYRSPKPLFNTTWFTVSCVLLIAPYFIAWSVLFGFLHRNYEDKRNQFLTKLFTFSPIGVLLLLLGDVYHVIECVFLKPIYFIVRCGRKLRSESFEELGYYKFRRVSEIFSESLMQAFLQLWILLVIEANERTIGSEDNEFNVSEFSVALSFLSSLFIIILWTVILAFESRKNGMTFVEYVTVIFQGSFKFVPYLPAIVRGKKNGKRVNWIYFKIRNSSVGVIANALISPLCQLQVVKLSSYSIRIVSRTGCRYLGKILRASNVELILSQKESQIKDLFDVFDIDKSGCFDFEEFCRVMLVMRSFRTYSTDHKLLYARMGNKRMDQLYENGDEVDRFDTTAPAVIVENKISHRSSSNASSARALLSLPPQTGVDNRILSRSSSSASSSSSDNEVERDRNNSVEYDNDSDEKVDRMNTDMRQRDVEELKVYDDILTTTHDRMRADRHWTDRGDNVSIAELIQLYEMLADEHHKKIWMLDLLIKIRSSVERLPCLDYDTPLYYAVKANNINLATLLMAYGYDKHNREEFEHCVIECIVTQQYRMAMVLCEQIGVPIVVHIRRGHHMRTMLNKSSSGAGGQHRKIASTMSMNQTRYRSGNDNEKEDNDDKK